MNFCVVLVAVVLWHSQVQVHARFYLEMANIPGNTDWFEYPTDFDGVRVWSLFECDIKKHQLGVDCDTRCTMVKDPKKKERVYAVANFNSVRNLEVSYGCTIEIEGRVLVDAVLAQAGWLGVEPRAFHKPNFTPSGRDEDYFKNRVASIRRFVDFDDTDALNRLLMFFSVNNIGWFFTHTAKPSGLFEAYEVVLQNVIEASGYRVEKDFWEAIVTKRNFGANHLNRLRSQSATRLRSLAQFLPTCLPKSQSKSQSQTQCPPQSQSPPSSPTEPTSQSPPRPSSRTTTRHPLPELKIDLIQATVILSGRMFDPCLVLRTGHYEQAQAESVCATYCRFLSMAAAVNQPYSKRCQHLKTGMCVNKMCVCLPRCGVVPTRNVNMVFCNNALRRHWHKAILVDEEKD